MASSGSNVVDCSKVPRPLVCAGAGRREFKSTAPAHELETVLDVAFDAKKSTELDSSSGIPTILGFESVLNALGVQMDESGRT
jgi:hypothetical protein